METLNWNYRFRGEDGRHDKIELRIEKSHLILGLTEDIDGLRCHISPSWINIMSGEINTISQEPEINTFNNIDGRGGWIFNVQQNVGRNRIPLKIRSNNFKNNDDEIILRAPLFSGLLFFTHYANINSDTNVHTFLSLSLTINPTRYIRHNTSIRYREHNTTWRHVHELTKRNINSIEGDEFSLDRKDNWIPNTPIYERLNTNRNYDLKLRRYVNCIIEAYDAEITRAIRFTAGNIAPQISLPDNAKRKYNLRNVETYWEFFCEDAVSMMKEIDKLSLFMGELDADTKDYPQNGETRSNTKTILKKIKSGIYLRIYAKTKKRIRFEICHNLTKCDLKFMPVRGRHTTGYDNGLIEMLESIRDNAAEQMNAIFELINNEYIVNADSATLSQFLYDYCRAVRDDEHGGIILSCLINHRKFNSNPGLENLLRRLKRRGILITVLKNKKKQRNIAPRYARALNQLRQMDTFPRIVQRQPTRARNRNTQNNTQNENN